MAIPAAEARHRYAHYYGYGPAYTYAPYGAGYYRGRAYYGSVYGRRCDPELFGRITRYTCAYRNWQVPSEDLALAGRIPDHWRREALVFLARRKGLGPGA